MTSSLQLVLLNVLATAIAWPCGLTVRGELEPVGATGTATFLMYTVWPLIGMALALVSIALAIRDARGHGPRWQALVAALLSVGILVVIPATFVAFTP